MEKLEEPKYTKDQLSRYQPPPPTNPNYVTPGEMYLVHVKGCKPRSIIQVQKSTILNNETQEIEFLQLTSKGVWDFFEVVIFTDKKSKSKKKFFYWESSKTGKIRKVFMTKVKKTPTESIIDMLNSDDKESAALGLIYFIKECAPRKFK